MSESPSQFGNLLDAMGGNKSVGIVYANATGHIRFWNEGAKSLFGYQPDEAIGQLVEIIIPPELRDMHWKGFRSRIGTDWKGSEDWATVPARHKDGSEVPARVLILPMHDGGGKVTGVVTVFRRPPGPQ